MNGAESADPSDSRFEKYYSYLQIYSNTPNLKGSVSLTNYNGIIDKLTSVITLKSTSKYDFVSGFFEATEEGKGDLPSSLTNQSFFEIQVSLEDKYTLIWILFTILIKKYISVFC